MKLLIDISEESFEKLKNTKILFGTIGAKGEFSLGKDVKNAILKGKKLERGIKTITCNECKHQKAIFHKDKRFKNGGYTYYQCEINSDPFVQHVVDGQPYQYCSEAEPKDEQNSGWRCGWDYIRKKEDKE